MDEEFNDQTLLREQILKVRAERREIQNRHRWLSPSVLIGVLVAGAAILAWWATVIRPVFGEADAAKDAQIASLNGRIAQLAERAEKAESGLLPETMIISATTPAGTRLLRVDAGELSGSGPFEFEFELEGGTRLIIGATTAERAHLAPTPSD